MRKKTTTAKSAVRAAAAEAKAVEAKAAEAALVEEKPAEVKEEVKAPVEEEAAKEPAKKAAKPAAKKPATKAAPAKKEKEEVKPDGYIQFQGQEAVVEEVIEKAKKQFVDEGHRMSTIKTIQVYLKPEEYAAYYVINQKHAGRVDLF